MPVGDGRTEYPSARSPEPLTGTTGTANAAKCLERVSFWTSLQMYKTHDRTRLGNACWVAETCTHTIEVTGNTIDKDSPLSQCWQKGQLQITRWIERSGVYWSQFFRPVETCCKRSWLAVDPPGGKLRGFAMDSAEKVNFRFYEPEALADFFQVERTRLAPQAHFCRPGGRRHYGSGGSRVCHSSITWESMR
jgi:hypothetical protein